MLLTSFSQHSVLIPRGQSVSAVTGGGVNIFAKIDSTLRVTTANPSCEADIIINESNIDNMNYLWKLTINASENVLVFTDYQFRNKYMHFLGSLLSHAMCCLPSQKYSPPLSRLTHSAHAGLARNVLKNL